jgi:hypothetical protein
MTFSLLDKCKGFGDFQRFSMHHFNMNETENACEIWGLELFSRPKLPRITVVACWAHTRRKYEEALQGTSKKNEAEMSSQGAEASAIIYSLVETAKENGLDPYHYLACLMREAPKLDWIWAR